MLLDVVAESPPPGQDSRTSNINATTTMKETDMRNALRKKALTLTTGLVLAASLLAAGSGAAHAEEPGTRALSCTTLHPSSGAVNVCKSWTPNGDGTFYGKWSSSGATPGVYLQGSLDGRVEYLNSEGIYDDVRKFLIRACKSGAGCTAWW
ncbi:hypothetical protein ABZ136_24285 [Streptomyces microflavus]|uniref:hypothetical protein n=2 Tax=Streptomyces microflavus TaxID=1919 RepID=UPI0033AE7FB9